MEHWGIKIDRPKLEALRSEYSGDVEFQAIVFQSSLDVLVSEHKDKGIDSYALVLKEKLDNGFITAEDALSSTRELSLLLFGGEITVTTRELIGKYKNGKDKYKNIDKKKYYHGIWDPKGYPISVNKLGWYPVDDDVLKSLLTTVDTAPLISSIRHYRDASKQLSTYVDGVSKSIWPGEFIHCNFNHTVTLTGRLSCSNPNLQNQTDGEIKKVYIPRDPEGMLIEYDYAQLEVVGLAVLSGDHQLIDDLKNGRDIHTELYKDMYHRLPTPAERKKFKPLTFGLIYGAGAKTLAENGGIPLSEAKKFIYTFYTRYEGVKMYHGRMEDNAKLGREVGDTKTEKGIPAGKYVYRTMTGREYEFREYDNEYKHNVSFSPTELKNWPVQGFATGDVVPLVLGHVVRELTASEWYGRILPIVTVHDSIMFEVRNKNDIVDARNYLDGLMSNTRNLIIERFGFDPGLDFNTESKVGYNWKELA
jgi:DNA polymerase-1